MLPKDDKWHLVPAGYTSLWGITIRNKDGSYREPSRAELDLLLEIYEAARVNIRDHVSTRERTLADALREALGMLRGYITLADDAGVPGSDVIHVDAARVRELGELID